VDEKAPAKDASSNVANIRSKFEVIMLFYAVIVFVFPFYCIKIA